MDEEIKDAASVRHMSLASGHWFFYVLILESEMEKTGARIWFRVVESLNFVWQTLILAAGISLKPSQSPLRYQQADNFP